MPFMGFYFESILSLFWEFASNASYEVALALVFVGGCLLTQLSQPRKKKAFAKRSLTPAALAAEKIGLDHHESGLQLDGQRFDIAMLKDPLRVVPQICQLCHAQVPQAIRLYHASMRAGLKLPSVEAQACHQLFMDLVTATIRTGRFNDAMKLFADLRECGLGVSTNLFASAVKVCTSKQLFAESLVLFDFMCEDPRFDLTSQSIWSCLLFCATEVKAYQKSCVFFKGLKMCGTPSPKDFGNMLRLAVLRDDWEKSVSLIREMRDTTGEIDSILLNTTLASCVECGKLDKARMLLDTVESVVGAADVITYNTILNGYVKAQQIDECFELFDRMRVKSTTPSQVTYGILLDGCINNNQLDRAVQVLNDMTAAGSPMNTILYTTLIKGFARAGKLESAMDMYRRMKAEHNILPDAYTFSILIKANCDHAYLEEALKLFAEMVTMGLKPDEVVFNNMLSGVAHFGSVSLGKQLYENMVSSGVRPSSATYSILIQLYHRCKRLGDAVEMLRVEPAKCKVELEPRLFLQLIQCCIRERQGKRAIEVYGMLAQQSPPTAAAHSSMLSTCMKSKMYEIAAEIVSMAAASGARVNACDTALVLDAAFQKRKTHVVQRFVASMQIMGHDVDPKFMDSSEPNTLPKSSTEM